VLLLFNFFSDIAFSPTTGCSCPRRSMSVEPSGLNIPLSLVLDKFQNSHDIRGSDTSALTSIANFNGGGGGKFLGLRFTQTRDDSSMISQSKHWQTAIFHTSFLIRGNSSSTSWGQLSTYREQGLIVVHPPPPPLRNDLF
jgi:hypothetical protein